MLLTSTNIGVLPVLECGFHPGMIRLLTIYKKWTKGLKRMKNKKPTLDLFVRGE
jgi:hypothetical protein